MRVSHINQYAYVLELAETNASRGHHIQIVKINNNQKEEFEILLKQYQELVLDDLNDMEDGCGFVNAESFEEIINFWKERDTMDSYEKEIILFRKLAKFPDFFPVCPAYLEEHNEAWLVDVKIKEILTVTGIRTFGE